MNPEKGEKKKESFEILSKILSFEFSCQKDVRTYFNIVNISIFAPKMVVFLMFDKHCVM